MVRKKEQFRMKELLSEAITVLCKASLTYRAEFNIEGLIGITLDNEEIFLVNINEHIQKEGASHSSPRSETHDADSTYLDKRNPTSPLPTGETPSPSKPGKLRGPLSRRKRRDPTRCTPSPPHKHPRTDWPEEAVVIKDEGADSDGDYALEVALGEIDDMETKDALRRDGGGDRGSGVEAADEFASQLSSSGETSMDALPGCSSWQSSQTEIKVEPGGDGGDGALRLMSGKSNSEELEGEGSLALDFSRKHGGLGFMEGPISLNHDDTSNFFNFDGGIHINNTHHYNAVNISPRGKSTRGRGGSIYTRRQCPECQRMFPSDSALNYHMRRHTGERPFCCPFCGKSFAMKQTMQTHILSHTGERPFRCPLCHRGFTQLHSVRSHISACHQMDSKQFETSALKMPKSEAAMIANRVSMAALSQQNAANLASRQNISGILGQNLRALKTNHGGSVTESDDVTKRQDQQEGNHGNGVSGMPIYAAGELTVSSTTMKTSPPIHTTAA